MRWFWSETRATHEQYEMISFSVDPQWCGLLFSIYCQNEKGGSFITGPGPADAFSCSVAGPPLDTDLIAWAGSVSFEICSLSTTCDLIVKTAKSTGVLIFLGLSGFFCYKLLNECWPRKFSKSCASKSVDSSIQSSHCFDEDFTFGPIKGEYFGPENIPNTSVSSSPYEDSTSCGEESRDADLSCNVSEISLNYHQPSNCSWRPDHSSTLCKSLTEGCSQRLPRDESFDSLGFSKRLSRRGSFDSTCSELSLDFSLGKLPQDTITDLDKLQQEIDALKSNCLLIDEDFENMKSNRNFPGMSSLLQAKSSRSQLNETKFNNVDTEREKQERAKACFRGLYSLTTVTSSTSSDFSESVRYSLGSSDSLEWDSPINASSPQKIKTSPVFPETKPDNGYMDESIVKFRLGNVTEDLEEYGDGHFNDTSDILSDVVPVVEQKKLTMKRSTSTGISMGTSEDEVMNGLEWDEADTMDLLKDESMLTSTDSCATLRFEESSPNRSWTTSPCTERSSKMESSGFGSQLIDALPSPATCGIDWEQSQSSWAVSSEDLGFMEWDGVPISHHSMNGNGNWNQSDWADSESSSVNASEMSTPANENAPTDLASNQVAPLDNIGPRLNLLQYAAKEWQGNTDTSHTILKGYGEIPPLLEVTHLRRVRGDNYCAVRAALFQTLSHGYASAQAAETLRYLGDAMNRHETRWLREWSFANRLSFGGNNVLRGMELCLQSLDETITLLSDVPTSERAERLRELLNSDLELDLRLVEAVKLCMMRSAMLLHAATAMDNDVPLFAMLLFARDTSETPRDFMNNHLDGVGNTGGLEQIEMFLLGHTLGVTIGVVRPKSFGTQEYICSYPDAEDASLPRILLVAEDDRHYNVLVE